jgi:sigma-E factor negative regulatory protein RseA
MTRLRAPLETLADPLPDTTMTSSPSASEMMSALADGQLRDDELSCAWRVLEQNDDAVASWNDYHLIGDILRFPTESSSSLNARADGILFVNRLNSKLRGEDCRGYAAGSSAQHLSVVADSGATWRAHQTAQRGVAANDGIFRWKILAGFATLAAVSVITWTATGSAGLSTTSPQLAESRDASQVLVASPQGAIVRDARLNELLAAHKQLGSMSALNAPSGLLQSAAFETSTGNGR